MSGVGLARERGCCVMQGTGGSHVRAEQPACCGRRTTAAASACGSRRRRGRLHQCSRVVQFRLACPYCWMDRSTRSNASIVMMLLPRITFREGPGQAGREAAGRQVAGV